MRLRSIWTPAVYHGHGKSAPYFEGWYYKLVDASTQHRYAVIPGIFKHADPAESHAFVQVLDGVSGESYYVRYPTEDFTALTTADDAPEYGAFLSVISGAIPNTIDSADGLFWYNLEENQWLWPTFNVFLVRKGGDVYKVQVTDYYSSTGASGFPTVRYEQIQ